MAAIALQASDVRLANGLGGKSFFTMTGELSEIEAAVDAAKSAVQEVSNMVAAEIMARPHKDLVEKIS